MVCGGLKTTATFLEIAILTYRLALQYLARAANLSKDGWALIGILL
jgi:hypothetical protein